MKDGSERRWIEGEGQTVLWANCTGRLETKKGDKSEEVEKVESSMRGVLPRNWALLFSIGKVIER